MPDMVTRPGRRRDPGRLDDRGDPKLPVRGTLRRIGDAYRARWRLLVSAALVVFVPLGALETAEAELLELELGSGGELLDVAFLSGLGLAVLLSTLGNQFYAGLAGEAARELRSGRRTSLRRVLRSLPYWRLVAIDSIVTVAVVVGLLLLVIPGVLAFAWLALAAPLVTIEGLGVRAALRRSRDLVRGSTLRVLAVLAPIVLVLEVVTEVVQDAARAGLGEGFSGTWVGSAAASTLLAPLFALATIVLTYELIDLRERVAGPPRQGGAGGPSVRGRGGEARSTR